MTTEQACCPRCGRAARPTARFCGSCGAALRPAAEGVTLAVGLPGARPAAPLAPGAGLGPGRRYTIVRALGRGGFGAAWLARDTRLGRDCVVKELALDPTWDAETRRLVGESFRREARLLVSLNTPGHPHIPEIYDYLDDPACLVMKWIVGESLDHAIDAASGRLPSADALRYARDVVSALAYMHGRSPEPVLHRDVKPANILLDATGRIWLIDFGLAKALPEAAPAGAAAGVATSQLAGTLGFTPPEQWRGRAEPRSDMYALGATLHRMLTGFVPDRVEVLALISGAYTLPPLRELAPELPAELEQLVARTLSADPAARPDAAELLSALDGLLAARTPPPPEPAHPPRVEGFVGRARELADLEASLAREHLAVITGPAGVGKTALAATLARRRADPGQVFWHSFREGEGAEVILWELAAFLAWHGRDELWRLLQGARQTGGQPPPLHVLFDYLLQLLRGAEFLLCLDDVQFVDDDPQLAQLLARLRAEAQARLTRLIISSRTTPGIIGAVTPLGGLGPEDASRLLAAEGVHLPPELAEALYERTGGNAQLLLLAAERIRHGAGPAHLIANLATTGSIERYLLTAVDAGLSEDERVVMQAVAVLLGYSGTRDAIEAVADTPARRLLADLTRRHLLSADDGAEGRTYSQHMMVREFYYDQLSRRERRALHQRAAAFYEAEERDALRAARHHERAGNHERAAILATADIWSLVSAGHARPLRSLLDQIAEQPLAPASSADVDLARGELAAFAGEGGAAQARFREVIETLGAMPGDDARYAQACLGLGAAFEHEAPQVALEWLERGLARAGETAPREFAAMAIKMGSVLIALGDLAAAHEALERGQARLAPGPSQQRVRALLTLGTLHSLQGDFAAGMACMEEGLAICVQLGDAVRMGELLSNLANDRLNTGDWPGALADFERALELARRTGNRRLQLIVISNLGFLRMRAGDLDLARDNLDEGIALARAMGSATLEMSVQCTLADLLLRAGEPAGLALDRAAELAAQTAARAALPEIGRLRAQMALDAGDAAAALAGAEEAGALAATMSLDLDQGIAAAVAAQALAALGERDAAGERFASAVATLDAADPYEAARARAAWGRAMRPADPDAARALIEGARATFARLGAARDLEDTR